MEYYLFIAEVKMSCQPSVAKPRVDIKMLMDGQLAAADLDHGGFYEGMAAGAVSIIEANLKTTPRAEWDQWVKEKLMQTPNASYWGFKAGVDF